MGAGRVDAPGEHPGSHLSGLPHPAQHAKIRLWGDFECELSRRPVTGAEFGRLRGYQGLRNEFQRGVARRTAKFQYFGYGALPRACCNRVWRGGDERRRYVSDIDARLLYPFGTGCRSAGIERGRARSREDYSGNNSESRGERRSISADVCETPVFERAGCAKKDPVKSIASHGL